MADTTNDQGLATFPRIRFSFITAPLTAFLQKKQRKLRWNEDDDWAFTQLKHALTSAPNLYHPDLERPFTVEVDASKTGVRAILSQRFGKKPKLFPVTFFSHKLTVAERSYDISNWEHLAVKLALKEWRHWLEGSVQPFVVLTDHKNLDISPNC